MLAAMRAEPVLYEWYDDYGPGELIAAFGGTLQIVAYECGLRHDPKPRVIQRIAAVNSDVPAPLAPALR